MLALLAVTHAASANSLLEFDAQEDPEGHFGLRVRAADSAPAFWRIFETGLSGEGGRVQIQIPDTGAPHVPGLDGWSVLLESGIGDTATSALSRSGSAPLESAGNRPPPAPEDLTWSAKASLSFDPPSTQGFTLTWRFEGSNPANPNEYVDIDAHGLFFEFHRASSSPLTPLEEVLGEIYGAVFQEDQFVASGFDAFSVTVTAVPEPESHTLIACGILVFAASLHHAARKPALIPSQPKPTSPAEPHFSP